MISYELSDDEKAVLDAARQVADSADPWAGLVQGGWLDLLLEDAESGLGYLGLVAEELGAAGVSVPLATTATGWSTLFGMPSEGRRLGVVVGDYCEYGAGADVVVTMTDGGAEAYDEFDVEAVGGLEGDPLARVTIRGEPVATCGDPAAVELEARRSTALVCSEMAGLVRRVLEMTLEHLRTREQFGRPLAAFQVIQHGAAHLATLSEAATWAGRLATHDPEWTNVHAAKGWLSRASQEISALSHQLHGATGFTEEYGLQRLTKRLRTLRFTFGDDGFHYAALGRLRATA